MANTCQCCGAEKVGSKCSYCGFVEIIGLDDSGTALVRTMAENHRKAVAGQVTDLSVVCGTYEWKESQGGFSLLRKEPVKLADGGECYPNVKWSDLNFGQQPQVKTVPLELSYRFRGSRKQLACQIEAPQCGDFWKLGLQMDQSLKLKVFLGTRQNCRESTPLELELK